MLENVKRQPRHDRSPLLYPLPVGDRGTARRSRCRLLGHLRCARTSYHLLADAGADGETAAAQLRWKLRDFAAKLGVSLVIAGVPEEPRGCAEIN